MNITTGLFEWLTGGYIGGMVVMFGYIYRLSRDKCDRVELEEFKKEFAKDLDRIRTDIREIYGTTQANRATLKANRDTLQLILQRLPS